MGQVFLHSEDTVLNSAELLSLLERRFEWGAEHRGSRQTSKYTDTLVPCGSKCREDQSEVGRQRVTGDGAELGMVVG